MSAQSNRNEFDARGDKEYFANLRDALLREADASRDGKSQLSKDDFATSEAGAALVGTERGFALVNDKDFMSLRRVQDDIYGRSTIHAMGDLRKTLSPGQNERPLWATAEEWADAKRSVQADFAKLSAKGYTEAEVAAAVRFYTHLRRRK